MFPKKGNFFPNGNGTGGRGVDYAAAVAVALRAELGGSHQAAKTVMRWTGANERTVKNWFSGRTGPRGEHLLALMRHSNGVLETILCLAGREHMIASMTVLHVRNMLTDMIARVDRTINGRDGN